MEPPVPRAYVIHEGPLSFASKTQKAQYLHEEVQLIVADVSEIHL